MKKKGKIARRTLLFIMAITVILLVSICVTVGVLVRNVLFDSYENFAFSYVNAAADFIDGDTIETYFTTGNKDAYYETIDKYVKTTADSTYFNSENTPNGASIKYLYVFVPGDVEYIYIWDAEPGNEPADLLETYPYSEGAKEQAEKMFNKEITEDSQYYVDAEDGIETLTVSVPLCDSKGKPVAIIAADLAVSGINKALRNISFNVIISIVDIMIITMVVFYFIIRKKIVDPIIKLNSATGKIIESIEKNEKLEIDIKTNDEIETLADSISDMDTRLREYISQNAAITAEKERIGAELELATRIQADMLPNIFPAFPERDDFDVYASMTPAKEVGGDFYDFFLVDDSHLALVMADVSGKGVPAALFMMMSKILIQNAAQSGKGAAAALETVNNQICSNNREEMFVTVWLGIVDLKTGLMKAANAGHEKPMIKKPEGEFEFFLDKHGFVIGGMPGIKYKEYEVQLEKGSKLFIYTDGVAEATNESDELFGTERTLKALNAVKDSSPDVILDNVKKEVDNFVGSAPQFDDLTMLCFEFKGECENEIEVEATLENVAAVTDFVSAKAEELPFSLKDRNQIEIAVDEIVSNVSRYAYGDSTGKVSLKTESDEKGLTIIITDSGTPYNPLEKDDPDISLSADERAIGGYGIFIVKKIMDDIIYKNEDGKNILTMTKFFNK